MIGRPRTCECDECAKCRRRDRARQRWQSMTPEERQTVVAARDREKVRAADRARYYRHREMRLGKMKEWAAKNRERASALNAEWVSRNPEKRAAHRELRRAVLKGDIPRQPCEVCGADRAHAHHDDYSAPLDVRWLCPAHHGEVHRRYQADAA